MRSPVDMVAEEVVSEFQNLPNEDRGRYLSMIIDARDASRKISEQIFVLLASLLLPAIVFVVKGETGFSFLGLELTLDLQSVFFVFFVGNLFYIYKISHFAKVVSAEKVLYQISQKGSPKLRAFIFLLPYNYVSLISESRWLTFYLKYFAITIYSLVYFTVLGLYIYDVFAKPLGLDWIYGTLLVLLNILSLLVSLMIFPNANLKITVSDQK